ncbi:hypothetical protein NPIL_169691 [Nephila pilipes]|uniref:Uncharacterized protein n=1 Tax=Nephila pilipes TaxID=299642 RepID=A0A8X6MGS9_NEPPI|nr:hypothetical protein NPIL_169691 [Nephila pilipes]
MLLYRVQKSVDKLLGPCVRRGYLARNDFLTFKGKSSSDGGWRRVLCKLGRLKALEEDYLVPHAIGELRTEVGDPQEAEMEANEIWIQYRFLTQCVRPDSGPKNNEDLVKQLNNTRKNISVYRKMRLELNMKHGISPSSRPQNSEDLE